MPGPWEKYSSGGQTGPWTKYSTTTEQAQKPSLARTILDQGLQGATFGFADEVTDRMGAGIATLAGAGDYDSLLNEARSSTKEQLAQQAEQRPVASFLANVGGGILTGGAGASTKAGTSVLNSIRSGNVAARVAKGAAAGAASGGLYGAGTGDEGSRLDSAKRGAVVGAVVGGAIPAAGAALGSVSSKAVPRIDEGLRDVGLLAQKYKIPVSFDQLSSSNAVKNVQKVSQELPFSGQDSFRDKQLSAFNRALLNTVGVDADKVTKSTMDKAFLNVGKEFDDLGKGKTFQLDDAFSRRLDDIRQEAQSISTRDAVANFENEAAKLLSEADPTGAISGEKLGMLRSRINRLARKSNNPDTQDLLHDLENVIIDTMTAGDDAVSGAFSRTKQKYKNLLVIEPLAAKGKGGNISPALLNNRVSKIYGRAHTTGNAGEIGDLAQIGHELLPELGGSDTTQKMITAAGMKAMATGAAIKSLPITAAGLAVNRAAQSGLNRNQKLISKALSPKEFKNLSKAEQKKLLNSK